MSWQPDLKAAMCDGVFWITSRIAIGQFASPKRAQILARLGVTHILNVGDAPSVITTQNDCFKQITDLPIRDLEPISPEVAIQSLEVIHAALRDHDTRIYVHCIAGQNRSPTVVWLYLIACGMSQDQAKQLITDRSPDAIPGHQKLLTDRLIEKVMSHGEANFLPLNDMTSSGGLSQDIPPIN